MTKPSLDRQMAVSALCGLCFALVLNFILIERITPWVILPSLPGLIASGFTVGFPPCGGRPPEGFPIDKLFPYVAMWFNAAFYSVATFVGYRVAIEIKRNPIRSSIRSGLEYKLAHSIKRRAAGSLLEFGDDSDNPRH